MRKALIVCASAAARFKLSEMLGSHFENLHAKSADDARSMIAETDPDLVVTNDPLPDESAASLALYAAANSAAGVACFLAAPSADDYDKLGAEGVAVIEKPFRPAQTAQTLWTLSSTKKRLTALRERNLTLTRELDTLRLVARAKALLIQNLRMTEPQAHHFIEKQAMDRRVSKRQVAEGVLSAYEGE